MMTEEKEALFFVVHLLEVLSWDWTGVDDSLGRKLLSSRLLPRTLGEFLMEIYKTLGYIGI